MTAIPVPHAAFDNKPSGRPGGNAPSPRMAANPKMRRDTLEYRLLFTAAWSIFLVGAIVRRGLHQAGPAKSRSLFAEATSSTNNAIACAFMG